MGKDTFCSECGCNFKFQWIKKILILIFLIVIIVQSSLIFYQYNQINDLDDNILSLNQELVTLRDTMQNIITKNDALEASVLNLEMENKHLANEIHTFQLQRPSLNELTYFLREDSSDTTEYVEELYVCINFAQDLRSYAKTKGYNLSFVVTNYDTLRDKGNGHAFCGAYLDTGDLIYIEPQTDGIYYSIEELLKDTFEEDWIEILEVAIIW